MKHTLPELPYDMSALTPHFRAETLEYHWGRHHRHYVDELNRLIAGTRLAGLELRDLVKRATGDIFNNAAQHYNHSLYWLSLSPKGGGKPTGGLSDAIDRSYGSFAAFRSAFVEMASAHFGSGWAWLVQKSDGAVKIEVTHDAGCPLTSADTPILACDLWEHAYYIDYRNDRKRYLEAFWELVNWRHAKRCCSEAGALPATISDLLHAPGP